MMFVIFGR